MNIKVKIKIEKDNIANSEIKNKKDLEEKMGRSKILRGKNGEKE